MAGGTVMRISCMFRQLNERLWIDSICMSRSSLFSSVEYRFMQKSVDGGTCGSDGVEFSCQDEYVVTG